MMNHDPRIVSLSCVSYTLNGERNWRKIDTMAFDELNSITFNLMKEAHSCQWVCCSVERRSMLRWQQIWAAGPHHLQWHKTERKKSTLQIPMAMDGSQKKFPMNSWYESHELETRTILEFRLRFISTQNMWELFYYL